MWTRAKFNKAIVPGLFAYMIDTYDKARAASMWKSMCDTKKSKKAYEENTLRSGLGYPVIKGEGAKITYDTQIEGASQKWVHDVYALAVRITEEAIEDNLYELNNGSDGGEIKEIAHDLGEAMAENKELLMARFLVNGTATTYHTTRDGKALFADDHPYLDGNTFDNKATTADQKAV